MKVQLQAIGRLKAGPERELCHRYIDRAAAAARSIGLTGVESRDFDESRARRPEDRKFEEAQVLRQSLLPGTRFIVLDERGKAQSSEAFAEDMGRARDSGTPAYTLVIGGPDGIDEALRREAGLVLAFGAMTWPHQLVRVMASEQIYRAITILAGHPYHRI